jgi:hypothetical protein
MAPHLQEVTVRLAWHACIPPCDNCVSRRRTYCLRALIYSPNHCGYTNGIYSVITTHSHIHPSVRLSVRLSVVNEADTSTARISSSSLIRISFNVYIPFAHSSSKCSLSFGLLVETLTMSRAAFPRKPILVNLIIALKYGEE